MGAKWSRALALSLHKEKLELLQGLVLEVLEEWLWHSVTEREVNTSNQSIKCNKHGTGEGGGDVHGAATREEEEAALDRRSEEEEGRVGSMG
jgi:hypothetical protein